LLRGKHSGQKSGIFCSILKKIGGNPMKRLTVNVILFTFAAFLLSNCATTGRFDSVHLTNVELGNKDYRILAKNISGEAAAGYLIGFSGSNGSQTWTTALLRIDGDGMLYKEALERFWSSFEEKFGSIEGRDLAIVNVRYDADAMNFFGIYTRPKISIRADVIEFLDEKP
jgi:hypothetical protein